MRASETRVLVLLLVAVGAAIAAAAIGSTRGLAGLGGATVLRGALLMLAALLCVVLAVLALRREWATIQRRLLEQVQSCLTGPRHDLMPVDRLVGPVVRSLRAHVEGLQGRVDQLALQKKNLEIQLRLAHAERQQVQAIVCGISDAVLVTDSFDELMMANPAAAEFFKFAAPLEKASRRPAADLLGTIGGGARLAEEIREMRQSHHRATRRTIELQLDHDGQARTFSITLTSMVDEDGSLGGVVTVLHDITREIEVSRMKTDFVSHVSHELRTPLSSIKAYAELLVDGEATDEKTRQEFYHVIQAEADRLGRMIDNILNISRIESGMTRVNRKPVGLSAVLKQVLEVAMPSAREKDITLVDQIPPVFFQVEADRDMVYQAALNLVSNAIKYTPSGGSVRLALRADEAAGTVTVTVTDTGVGIPPEAMKHLFDKFYRVEQHKGMAKGSGLGLNLTRQIIEQVHKGKMLVESTPGQGSTFGFLLPLLPA